MPPEADGGGDGPDAPVVSHRPVLLQRVIEHLAPGPGMVYVDGTVGSGGHFGAVAPRLAPGGIAIGIDRDKTALLRTRAAIERLQLKGVAWHLVHATFAELRRVVAGFGLYEVDLALLDCGVSSEQLEDPIVADSLRQVLGNARPGQRQDLQQRRPRPSRLHRR